MLKIIKLLENWKIMLKQSKIQNHEETWGLC